jgi:D-alanyl-D-alanine carboxypeptidase
MMNNNRRSQRPPPQQQRRPNNSRPPVHNKPQPQKRRRRKKRPNYLPLIIFVLLIIALVFIIFQCTKKDEETNPSITERVVSMSAPETVVTEEPYNIAEIQETEIYSYAAVLYNRTTNRIICEKNMDEVTYPASLTKIMTAIIAIESIDSSEYYDTYITLDADMFDYINTANASTAGFKAGEKVRIIDLLYGIILPSGADSCIALARYIAGSESGFADLMNAKAAELGCENTTFINSTGLHDINHRSTARDILTILNYALRNDLFYTIFTTESYTTGSTSMREEGFTFKSTVFRAFTNNDYEIGNIIGGKTGYTIEAKLCLSTLAKTLSGEYILITLGAGEGDNNTAYHVMDTVKLYETYTD